MTILAKRAIMKGVKLTYETAIATFIQFIVLSLLQIVNGIYSVATTCSSDGGDCVSNMISSLIFFILISIGVAAVWLLGFAAQDRRSKRLARLLIAIEGFIALIELFDAKHYTDFLGLFTSLVGLVMALWIISLAFRLMRSGGGRVVARQRRRRVPRDN